MHSTFGMAKLLPELNINNFHDTSFFDTGFKYFSVPVVVCWEIFSFSRLAIKINKLLIMIVAYKAFKAALTVLKAPVSENCISSRTEIRQH